MHVSVAARDVRSWVRRLGQPADWAFGLPVTAPARLLWAVPEWRRRIDLPVLCQPADEPRLEELIATLGKVAATAGPVTRSGSGSPRPTWPGSAPRCCGRPTRRCAWCPAGRP